MRSPLRFPALPCFTAFMLLAGFICTSRAAAAAGELPSALTVGAGWQMQDIARVPQRAEAIARPGFAPQGWYRATVPGTVLTTLVNDGVYP